MRRIKSLQLNPHPNSCGARAALGAGWELQWGGAQLWDPNHPAPPHWGFQHFSHCSHGFPQSFPPGWTLSQQLHWEHCQESPTWLNLLVTTANPKNSCAAPCQHWDSKSQTPSSLTLLKSDRDSQVLMKMQHPSPNTVEIRLEITSQCLPVKLSMCSGWVWEDQDCH